MELTLALSAKMKYHKESILFKLFWQMDQAAHYVLFGINSFLPIIQA
jgi:hypothetical protein